MDNLLKPNKFYYHPFTREARRPPVVDVQPSGQVVYDDEEEFKISFKVKLIPQEVVEYYYSAISMPKALQEMKRDIGAVKYMAERNGTDSVLFAIDALVDDYYDSEHRSGYYPSILDAQQFLQEANERLGIAKQIARQYHIDEDSFNKAPIV